MFTLCLSNSFHSHYSFSVLSEHSTDIFPLTCPPALLVGPFLYFEVKGRLNKNTLNTQPLSTTNISDYSHPGLYRHSVHFPFQSLRRKVADSVSDYLCQKQPKIFSHFGSTLWIYFTIFTKILPSSPALCLYHKSSQAKRLPFFSPKHVSCVSTQRPNTLLKACDVFPFVLVLIWMTSESTRAREDSIFQSSFDIISTNAKIYNTFQKNNIFLKMPQFKFKLCLCVYICCDWARSAGREKPFDFMFLQYCTKMIHGPSSLFLE